MNWVPFLSVLVATLASTAWMGLALGSVLSKMGTESRRAWVPVERWIAAAEVGRASRATVLVMRSISAVGIAVLLVALAMRALQGDDITPLVGWLTLAGIMMFGLGAFVGWICWIMGAGTIAMRLNIARGWTVLAALSPYLWAAILGWSRIGTPIPADAIGRAASAGAARRSRADATPRAATAVEPSSAADSASGDAPTGDAASAATGVEAGKRDTPTGRPASVFGDGTPGGAANGPGAAAAPAFDDRPFGAAGLWPAAKQPPATAKPAADPVSAVEPAPPAVAPTMRAASFVPGESERPAQPGPEPDREANPKPNLKSEPEQGTSAADVSQPDTRDAPTPLAEGDSPAASPYGEAPAPQETLDQPTFEERPPEATSRPVSPYITGPMAPPTDPNDHSLAFGQELVVEPESFVVPQLVAEDHEGGEHADDERESEVQAEYPELPASVLEQSEAPAVPAEPAVPETPTEPDVPAQSASSGVWAPPGATAPPVAASAAVDAEPADVTAVPEPVEGDLPADGDGDDHTVITQRRRDVWVLEVDGGDSYPLPDGEVTIGRATATNADGKHVGVDDATRTMSKRHAKLRLDDGDWRVSDLGSTNGTFVRAEDHTEVEVAPGTEVVIAGVLLLGDLEARIVNRGTSRS